MKSFKYILAIAVCITFTQCKDDFLNARSPSSVDDEFVTTTPAETFKILSWGYANYRQSSIMGVYRWNDPIGSDAETYPEDNSSNNLNAILRPELIPVDAVAGGFNGLYGTIRAASKVASLIAEKQAYKDAVAAGQPSDWTQLYGEALTMRAFCYAELVKHFGDVPYGYENTIVDEYSLTSRFVIYDDLIEDLKKAEPLMYRIGEGGINAERFSRTYCNALIGQLALHAGGYQTIRTDIPDLYGSVSFSRKGNEAHNSVYARRSDYLDYYQTAKTYLQKAIDNRGTAGLITNDNRSFANNPFQRHFQYFAEMQVSPESLFEIGNIQGGQLLTSSEYPYAFGRPSDGGSSNSAPNKVFGALRIFPTVYYGEYRNDDKRRDASVAVTGSRGDGNEMMLSFVPGNKNTGGISTNKWDENRMNPPYTPTQRAAGLNWPILRMADVILMLAEAKAEIGEADAISLVNQIRERAFGNASNNLASLSGEDLKEAIMQERKLELLGEGTRRWDMIRSGKFSEKAIAIQQEMATMISNLRNQGYHRFANGNEIPAYIWTKMVSLPNPLTFDADITNPALYPGWRGQYNYSSLPAVSSKVVGTNHNVAIQGLFRYIAPGSPEALSLESQGYVRTNWAIEIVNYEAAYKRNALSGITSAGDPPRYYWPIPSETIRQSKGAITNGYGLAQP
ncbi:putative outer membrane starch-binding protein [Arcticibacter pallidicorallinus]|uniref:Putative outer membrane starch-binding protein n=1 Tax=Arcticibacter pallidicorallinus TaxID=1259464 RepID=A0A2T0U425_9SPHI|nr:RagB/SusD family nutrient uptake outer membrane protein [Arcticibacter pallidicorallinus]PRY52661.1 putative outer membrane starch-binding protein [Arcticibacter pallidicorallinus]